MLSFILAIVLLLLALAGVVVRKTYYALPMAELKRKAERHDPLAVQLYPAVAYGSSLRTLLWLYIGLTSAASLIVLARQLPVWLSLVIVGPLLWAAFSWLPASRTSKLGRQLASRVAPVINGLLNFLHPALSRSADAVQARLSTAPHTGIFERDDLVALIERQQHQTDSRLSDEELEIAKRALQFEDYAVADLLTPRKQVKMIKPDDTVGPVLIDEVHKSGGGYALVREKPKAPFVGSLAFARLGIHATGKVSNLMETPVYYLHESDSLSQALHAFFTTNHPMFVVINSFEEFVGIVTIESVLKLLLGHVPGDDFDEYANPTAVAARHPKSPEPELTIDPIEAPTAETPVDTEEMKSDSSLSSPT